MLRRREAIGWFSLTMIFALCFSLPGAAAEPQTPEKAVTSLEVAPVRLDWRPQVSSERWILTVSGPGDLFIRQEFEAGQSPFLSLFDPEGQRLPDGNYTWELRGTPKVDALTKEQLSKAREVSEQGKSWRAVKLPGRPLVQSGHFFVREGSFAAAPAETAAHPSKPPAQGITPKNFVETGTLVVQNNACIGNQCATTDANFSALKLKSTLPNLLFDDVDVPCEGPPPCPLTAHDWALLINPSDVPQFSIKDVDGNLIPFSVAAGAPTNSLYVGSNGNVGLGTSTPVLDLHLLSSNTPAVRLEQDGTGGFTPQTWDVAGNEANFFVRDVTGGSRLPFRIRPGAPTSSIDVSAAGNVGLGTASPSTQLHVFGTDSGSRNKILVENASGTTNGRELLEIRNNGAAAFILKDTSQTTRWSFGTLGSSLIVDNQANAGVEMSISNTGNVVIAGTLTTGSSRALKTALVSLDPTDVLARVSALPVSLWSYKTETAVRHVGPMAEDFHQIFGLGADDKHIAPGDQAGVALLAVQGLNRTLQNKAKEIAALQHENADLAKRVATLEALLATLMSQKGASVPSEPAP